jgi:hypothetical protein
MRRTFIIGIGGAGFDVARSVADRVLWDRSLDEVPYLDFLCIDSDNHTENHPLTAGDNAYFYHLKADEHDLGTMRTMHENLGPQTWMQDGVFEIKNAVAEGTSGYRMLGRMTMFLNQNFHRLETSIRKKINRLALLDASVASEGIRIVVVATACGGTGSGTFVDMGFLLRKLRSEFNTPIDLTGILTLPPTDEADETIKANAYAALIELNHFCTDRQVYSAHYPGSPNPVSIVDQTPFDLTYLVTLVKRPGGLGSPKELNATIGQFLYTDIAHPAVAEKRDARIDDIKPLFSETDELQNTQRYLTFGVSYIQYPVERIQLGCTYKLLSHTFAEWLKDHRDAVAGDPFEVIDMTPSRMWRELERMPRTVGGTSISDRLNDVVEEVVADYAGPEDLDEVRARIEEACAARPGADPGSLTPGSVPRIMADNVAEVRTAFLQHLRTHLEEALFDIDRGPSYCLAYMRALRAAIAERRKRNAAADPGDFHEPTGVLRQVDRDLLLGFPLFARGTVARFFLGDWEEGAKRYFLGRVREVAAHHEKVVYSELEGDLDLLESRLRALNGYLLSGLEAMRGGWEEQDAGQALNGRLLFKPGSFAARPNPDSTIHKEYQYLLDQNETLPGRFHDSEREAQRRIVGGLRRIAIDDGRRDLFARGGQSVFDDERIMRFGFSEANLRLCLDQSMGYFGRLADRSVFDELEDGSDELKNALRQVHALSEIFLPLQENADGYRRTTRMSYSAAAYRGAGEPQKDDPRIERFEATLQSTVGKPEFFNYDNPTTVVFLNERGAFPLRIIRGVDNLEAYYKSVSERRKVTLHSRADVPWLPINTADRRELQDAEEALVLGLALGYVANVPGRADLVVPMPEGSVARDVTLTRGLSRASVKLSREPRAVSAIRAGFARDRRAGLSAREIVTRLYVEFPATLTKLDLVDIKGLAEPWNKRVKMIADRIRDNDPTLTSAYDEVFKPREEDMQHLFRVAGELVDPKNPERGVARSDGYYCSKVDCNASYGRYEDMGRKCERCGVERW